MGQCKPIYGLVFDSYSRKTLKRMSQNSKFKQLIDSAAIAGTFNALFTKSGVGSASVNIALQDWDFLFNAVKSTRALQDYIIRRDIEYAQLYYRQNMNNENLKLIQFWEGLANGCKY